MKRWLGALALAAALWGGQVYLSYAQFAPSGNGGNIPVPGNTRAFNCLPPGGSFNGHATPTNVPACYSEPGQPVGITGHFNFVTAPNLTPPTVNGGSSNGTLNANATDNAFIFTSPGGASTTAEIDFGSVFEVAPVCVATPGNSAASTAGLVSAPATTAHVVLTYGSGSSLIWNVQCAGYGLK